MRFTEYKILKYFQSVHHLVWIKEPIVHIYEINPNIRCVPIVKLLHYIFAKLSPSPNKYRIYSREFIISRTGKIKLTTHESIVNSQIIFQYTSKTVTCRKHITKPRLTIAANYYLSQTIQYNSTPSLHINNSNFATVA